MPSNIALRLVKRLRTLNLDIPEGSKAVRLHPCEADRALGAWSWGLVDSTGAELHIGGWHSMTQTLRAPHIITEHYERDVEIVPIYHETSPREEDSVIKLNVIRDDGTRMVDLVVDDAPDITPEQSYIQFGIRPSMLSLRYTSSGTDPWTLADVTVTGRAVNAKDGTVNLASRRTHSVTYTDLKGSGGIHKAVTPKWVIDLASKYGNTPDELPRSR